MPRRWPPRSTRLRALLRQPDMRAERNEAHAIGARRGLHPRPRVRARRAAAPRRAAGAGDLRQARSARRPVLRGNDLRDAVVGAARHAAARSSDARRRAPRAALGLHHGPIHAECRVNARRRVRARSRGAADRRPVRARAAVQLRQRRAASHLARGAPAAACARRSRRAVSRARRAASRRDDDSDPEARHLSRRRRRRGGARRSTASTRSRSPPSRISCWCRCRKAPATSGSSSRAAASPAVVEQALRAAHAQLAFAIDAEFPVLDARPDPLQSSHG